MSKIEWTGKTWNPIVGCSVVSPGCTNCYAMKDAWRFHHNSATPHYRDTAKRVNGKAVWTGKVALAPDHILLEPLRRKKPTTWFVNSMGDLFHEDVPDEWIDRVFAIMALCPSQSLQVLTKRSARMRKYVSNATTRGRIAEARLVNLLRGIGNGDPDQEMQWPLPNVWLGVSTEDQKRADERIPDLLATPAAVRFISAEPLIGPIKLKEVLGGDWLASGKSGERRGLDLVIVGGESGKGARPMHPDWARALRDQCASAGVPFFMKQMTKRTAIPSDLFVREFPSAR